MYIKLFIFFMEYHKYLPLMLRIIFIVSIYIDNLEIAYAMGSQDINPDLTDAKAGSGNNPITSAAQKSESSTSSANNYTRSSDYTNESNSDKRSSMVYKRVGDRLQSEANNLREELANPKLLGIEREKKEEMLSDLLDRLSLTDTESSKNLRKAMEMETSSAGTKRSGEESSTAASSSKKPK